MNEEVQERTMSGGPVGFSVVAEIGDGVTLQITGNFSPEEDLESMNNLMDDLNSVVRRQQSKVELKNLKEQLDNIEDQIEQINITMDRIPSTDLISLENITINKRHLDNERIKKLTKLNNITVDLNI